MLTKALKHDCLTINGYGSEVCSYNLKTATFECLKTKFRNWKDIVERARIERARSKKIPESKATPEDIIKCAHMILSELEQAIVGKKQMSFFLRDCDLMTHSIDKTDDRQLFYIRYCKALICDVDGVEWENLVAAVAKLLLTHENINEKCFVRDTKILLDMGLNVSANESLKHMLKMNDPKHVYMSHPYDEDGKLRDKFDRTALHEWACVSDGDEVLSDEESLLPPIWEQFNNKDRNKVGELIIDGHDVNIPNAGERSLLQESLSLNDFPLIRDLCNSPNIDVNQRDIYGRTALFYAVNCFPFPVPNNTQTSVC
jgi:hypothetical protein